MDKVFALMELFAGTLNGLHAIQGLVPDGMSDGQAALLESIKTAETAAYALTQPYDAFRNAGFTDDVIQHAKDYLDDVANYVRQLKNKKNSGDPRPFT